MLECRLQYFLKNAKIVLQGNADHGSSSSWPEMSGANFMYYVYLIQCEGGSIYTGITTDLERRFKEHSDKAGGHYTRAHKVEKILYTEEYSTRSEALKREAEIKKLRRKEKLKLVDF